MTFKLFIVLLFSIAILYLIQYIRSKRKIKLFSNTPFELKYKFDEKYLDIDGVKICYVEEGDGKPLVFIHGWSASIDYWDYNIPYFQNRYRVYALDLPGYGRSDKPIQKYTLNYFTDIIKKFLDKKGIEKAFIVGHSMGGMISINFTLNNPERIEKLVLVDPAGIWGAKGYILSFLLKVFGNHRWLINAGDDEVKMAVKKIVFFDYKSQACRDVVDRHLAFRKSKELFPHSYASHTAAINILKNPLNRRVDKISVPTLVIWGRNDRLVSWKHGCFLASKIPDSILKVINKSGHCPQLEKPNEFNRTLEGFLKWDVI